MNNLPSDLKNIIFDYSRYFGHSKRLVLAFKMIAQERKRPGEEDIHDVFACPYYAMARLNDSMAYIDSIAKYICKKPFDVDQLSKQILLNSLLRDSHFFDNIRKRIRYNTQGLTLGIKPVGVFTDGYIATHNKMH